MRARSLKAWSETPEAAEFGLEVNIMQVLESVSGLYRLGVKTYNWIQLHAPWLHHAYFNFLEKAAMHSAASKIRKGAATAFVSKINDTRPRLIISTHAHLNHGFFELAVNALGSDKVKTAIYCGELFGGYGFSRHWVNPKADLFIGAVKECCDAARALGMPEARTHSGGFMLNPAFWNDPMDAEQKRKWIMDTLALEPDRPSIVLATGANSANNHLPLLKALATADVPDIQAIALCGRNDTARQAVKAWARQQRRLTVAALPRLDSMEMCRLLQCAAAVVARPGTGTTSEAILCGCPSVSNGIGGIMPQEWLTVKFLKAHDAAHVMTKPIQLAKELGPLLSPESQTAARERMLSLRPEGHPLEILRRLRSLADS